MSPDVICPFNRHERHGRTSWIAFAMAVLVLSQGCGQDSDPAGVERITPVRRARPEGILLVVRELDLGTLPLNGSMELLISVKNPLDDQEVTVARHAIDHPGLRILPDTFSIGPEESMPITIKVTPEATKIPGISKWEISAWTPDDKLGYRTGLTLVVKDDVIVKSQTGAETKTKE